MLRLLASAALLVAVPSAALAAPDNSANSREKLICKKFLETGSLVKGHRVCKTKSEWEKERANIRASVVGGGACASGQSGTCQ